MAKIRQGFVSNSSSSSFVCNISGEAYEGHDGDYSGIDYAQCVKGHEYVYDGFNEVGEWINSDSDEDRDDGVSFDDRMYEVPEEICPICNGKAKPIIVKRLKDDMKRLNIEVQDLS